MQQTEHRSFASADEVREFPERAGGDHQDRWRGGGAARLRARVALVQRREAHREHRQLPGASFPVPREWAAGDPHGRRHRVRRRPGDVTSLPSGHDAWVVGDEPVVTVDWFGASNYAK